MTKLIDADEFIGFMTKLYKVAGWDEREVHFSLADLKTNLDFEKSVEAIPVEWLENEIELLKAHRNDPYWVQYCVDLWKGEIPNE